MASFNDISILFRNAESSMKARVSSVLYNESRVLLTDFQERSPVDSGDYRSAWQLRKARFSPSGTLAGYSITNDTPYAYFMEFGAEKGKAPWFYPRKSRKGRTGKLIVRNQRVWAGGLNPGHSKTVKGAIGPVLVDNNKRLNQLTNKLADAVIGGFK